MANKVTGIYGLYAAEIIEIPFRAEEAGFEQEDEVIFKDPDGKEEFGIIKYLNCDQMTEENYVPTSKILRRATANDIQKVNTHFEQADGCVKTCKSLVKKHGLDMQIFRACYSFDGNKLCFMFTADDRIDFRELVKDLAKAFQKQIHLRQVGPRDRARILGGFGRCGRTRCSTAFLKNLESINMEMVRVQAIEGRGSSKLSGACGKLLCSLRYEVEAYRYLKKSLPELADLVKLKKASVGQGLDGQVVGIDILNQKIKVQVESDRAVVVTPADIEKIKKGDSWEIFEPMPEKVLDNKNSKTKINPEMLEGFMENQLSRLTSIHHSPVITN